MLPRLSNLKKKIKKIKFKDGKYRSVEITQLLRVLAILAKDLNSVPSTHKELTPICKFTSRGSETLLASAGTKHTIAYIVYMQTKPYENKSI